MVYSIISAKICFFVHRKFFQKFLNNSLSIFKRLGEKKKEKKLISPFPGVDAEKAAIPRIVSLAFGILEY